MVNREIAVLYLGKADEGWNLNMTTNHQVRKTAWWKRQSWYHSEFLLHVPKHILQKDFILPQTTFQLNLGQKHFVCEGRKERSLNVYSALCESYSPQPHTTVIRLTKSVLENTFICNQPAKSKLHKRVFLKIMCITSTTICWRTSKEVTQNSPVSALRVTRWDWHRILWGSRESWLREEST